MQGSVVVPIKQSSKYLTNLLCRRPQTMNRIGYFRNVIRLLLIIIISSSECSRNSALYHIVFFLTDKCLFTHLAFYRRNKMSYSVLSWYWKENQHLKSFDKLPFYSTDMFKFRKNFNHYCVGNNLIFVIHLSREKERVKMKCHKIRNRYIIIYVNVMFYY